MKLAGDYSFESSIQDVWDALFDPAVLAAVMPGCEKLELVDGSYLGEIKVKVGPIQGKFSGKVDLSDQVEPKSYKMVVDGRGAQGFVKATATIELHAEGTGTKIHYDSDAQVGGKIASVGQRLVETSARAIVKQSLEGLAENIKIRTAAHRAHAAAAAEPAVAATAIAAPEPAAIAPPVVAAPEPVAIAPAVVAASAPGPAAIASAVVAASAPDATEPVTEAAKPVLAVVPAPSAAAKPAAVAAAPAVAAAVAAAPAVAAPAVVAAAAPAAPKPSAPLPIAYKKADAGKLAGTVAKEVTKTLAPVLLIAAAVIAIVIYLLAR